MKKLLLSILLTFLSISFAEGRDNMIVADSVSRQPLPSATVFNGSGKIIGLSDAHGLVPYVSPEDYPITLRYLGFREKVIARCDADTVFLTELKTELPEILVESRQHKVLHMLAYVREYSSLSTYSDTVFLFREKMVDYMMSPDRKVRAPQWLSPRILKSKSYYHFTNELGLDSVSSTCRHHFSWSDWVEIVPSPVIPQSLRHTEIGTDTLRGKYSLTEIWMRNNERLTVDINVLADTTSRKWVSNLSVFFRERLDFENFRVRFNYDNIMGDSIYPTDITGYSFNIESTGRGHDMFRFNKKEEPFFVSTYAEVYVLDKEYVTIKEAKKWDKLKFDHTAIEIIEPQEAPELQSPVQDLITRVTALNHNDVRLDFSPDRRLAGRGTRRQNMAQRAFTMLKDATGITYYKSHKNFNTRWNKFKKEQIHKNTSE